MFFTLRILQKYMIFGYKFIKPANSVLWIFDSSGFKNTRIDNYKLDKKTYQDLNFNLSKSFFDDFSNFYVQHLATKHKLKRNYQELDNYFP